MNTEIQSQTMSEADAAALTEKIRITAHNYAEYRQRLQELVAEAKTGNAHLALGYASWTAYLSEVLGEEPMRLARGERQEMVTLLSSEGMSTRAIAPIVGATHTTVRRDVEAHGTNVPPEPELTDEPGQVTKLTGSGSAAGITGRDGKTYTRPDPKPEAELPGRTPPAERRPSILDGARNAGWELRKAVERIQRIQQDDRFNKNKAEILAALQPHLDFANEVLQDL